MRLGKLPYTEDHTQDKSIVFLFCPHAGGAGVRIVCSSHAMRSFILFFGTLRPTTKDKPYGKAEYRSNNPYK